jgi:hypothetical protein
MELLINFLPEAFGGDAHHQQTLIMLTRSIFFCTLAAFAVFCALAASADTIHAGCDYLELHASSVGVLNRSYPFLFSGSSNQILDLDENLVLRISVVHSGNATVKLWLTLSPAGVGRLLGQFQLSLSDQYLLPARVFEQFKENFWRRDRSYPLLILTSKEKLLEHARTSKIGSTAQLMFGANMPIFQTQVAINVKNNFSIDFRNSLLVEPLYFHIEIQNKFAGSLSGAIDAQSVSLNSNFLAVDYAVLVVGYVNDFRVWVDVGVMPSDAHTGNLFYNLSLQGNASFFWGEFGTASKPSDDAVSWNSAIACFNFFMRELWKHLLPMKMLPNRDIVDELLDMVNKSTHWQTYPHGQTRAATALLQELQVSLIDRVVSSPAEVRLPFFQRLPALAAQPMTKMSRDIVQLKQEAIETKQRSTKQNQKIKKLKQEAIESNQKIEKLKQEAIESNQKIEKLQQQDIETNQKFENRISLLTMKFDDLIAKLLPKSHSEL